MQSWNNFAPMIGTWPMSDMRILGASVDIAGYRTFSVQPSDRGDSLVFRYGYRLRRYSFHQNESRSWRISSGIQLATRFDLKVI